MIKGKVHSIESMGLVDGPGIRTVIFLQGCKLRCVYCHNPDTWKLEAGLEMTPQEFVKKVIRFKPYFDKSGGGVTFSGGDPLFQPAFLLETLKLCKENNIHTAIDTAGYGEGNYGEILKYTDLVILDLKHRNSKGYVKLTGKNTKEVNDFLNALRESNTKVWVRHVIVPGYTDTEKHIIGIAKIIKEEIPNVEKVELLPYHTLGVNKYKELGIKYGLENVEPMSKSRTIELQSILEKAIGMNKT